MKRYILFFLFSGLSFLTAREITESETIEKSFEITNPSKDFLVAVDNVFGSVRVTGTNKNTVSAKIKKSVWARSKEQFEKAREEVVLEIVHETGVIEFYVDGPFRDNEGHTSNWDSKRYTVKYDFEIQVPYHISIDIRTVNDGDICAENIRGDYQIHNVNGGIEMTGIGGSGDAITVNGEVSCRFNKNPETDCEFKSINGDIRLYLQNPVSADVSFKTLNGEMYSDFEVSSVNESQFVKTHKHGKTIYKAERPIKVRIGDGGVFIAASGINGDLFVLKNQ